MDDHPPIWRYTPSFDHGTYQCVGKKKCTHPFLWPCLKWCNDHGKARHLGASKMETVPHGTSRAYLKPCSDKHSWFQGPKSPQIGPRNFFSMALPCFENSNSVALVISNSGLVMAMAVVLLFPKFQGYLASRSLNCGCLCLGSIDGGSPIAGWFLFGKIPSTNG